MHVRFPKGKALVPKHLDFTKDLQSKLHQNPRLAKMMFEEIVGVYEGRTAKDVLVDIGEKREKALAKSIGYSVEYILNCLELIFEQEDINYPRPRFKGRKMTLELLQDIIDGIDIETAIKKAQL